jgi:hypothetical protein
VRFNLQGAIDQPTYTLDFFRGNFCWPRAPGYEAVDARRRNNAQHSIKAATQEHVIWEKWEQYFLLTVLPPMDGSILRKKYVESLARKGLGDCFLMLMASVEGVPPRDTRASSKTGEFLVP